MEELELLSDDEVKELILALVKGQGAASDEDLLKPMRLMMASA